MIEKMQKLQNEAALAQMGVVDSDEFEAVGVDVYTQGCLVIADLTHVNSLSFISVYDDQGVIVKTVKSNGLEVVKIKVPKKGVNQVQIQNGSHLFTQELPLH